jgi:hypothetical protein
MAKISARLTLVVALVVDVDVDQSDSSLFNTSKQAYKPAR